MASIRHTDEIKLSPEESDEEIDSVLESNKLFMCLKENCINSFMKFGNLHRHLMVGKNRLLLERTSLRDAAIQSYRTESIRTPQLPDLQEALETFYESVSTDNYQYSKGWALKKGKDANSSVKNKNNFCWKSTIEN